MILDNYYEWLKQEVDGSNYDKLLSYLNETPFYTILNDDLNRIDDGLIIREHYIHQVTETPESVTRRKFKCKPCSVLEMMYGLATRMEDGILGDSEYGDRRLIWFWGMIKSLGLIEMTDDNYDEIYVEEVIHRFLERDYSPDGHGGLFTTDFNIDMREISIWSQMNTLCEKLL